MTVTASVLTTTINAHVETAVLHGDGSIAIRAATHDSRAVAEGSLFCCVPGEHHDGHDFADVAVTSGASALLVERRLSSSAAVADAPQIVVPSVRTAMGPASSEIYGHPSESLDVIGVTGTNGKTSVVHLLGSMLERLGTSTLTVGTLSGARTTPEAPELQSLLADAAADRVGAVAMEVSSHALALHRVDGTRFRAAVFTNLGHDHLDFHHSTEAYLAAKARLFTPAFTDTSIINLDDPAGRSIADGTSTNVIGFRLSDAESVRIDGPVSRFRWRGHEVVLRLAGAHNILNALAAAAVASHLGHDSADVADALCAVDAPRGRFEFVSVGQPFHVVVDYAHKPEALSAVIRAGHEVAGKHRVIVVVGCGGDRDREKRPMMGRVAATEADHVILTSDNPRSEDPESIIDAMLEGIGSGPNVVVEVDRRSAIALAIDEAEPGDLVLIAGKGHEDYQVVGDTTLPFDDRAIAAEFLSEARS